VDILFSIWFFIGSWAADESDVIPDGLPPLLAGTAHGSQGTCSAQGFFLQLGIAVPLYNASQSIYAVLVVRYGMKEFQIQQSKFKWTWWLLGFPFLFGLGTAVTGLVLELYNMNPSIFLCSISPYPADCDPLFGNSTGPCKRGTNANKFRMAFVFAPIWGSLLVMIISMILVTSRVLQWERKAKEWVSRPFNQIESGHLSGLDCPNQSSTFTNHQVDLRGVNKPHEGTTEGCRDKNGNEEELDENKSPADQIDIGNSTNNDIMNCPITQNNVDQPEGKRQSFVSSLRASLSNVFVRKEDGQRLERTKKVTDQSIFFVVAFIASWLCSMIYQTSLMANIFSNIGNRFGFVLISTMLFPLQGFFNALVVIRPRYVEYRQRFPSWKRTRVFHQALFHNGEYPILNASEG
jgi:hypothetical protein